MGYRCPVCEDPQPDAEHLANHLAFTGLMGHEDHEGWLDEHVSDWADHDPDSLGEALAEIVPTVDLDALPSEGHEHRGRPTDGTVSAANIPEEDLDPVTAAALADAREMSREMVGGTETDGQSEASSESSETGDAGQAEGEDR